MAEVTEIAEAMYKAVKDAHGMKKFKPTDLTKMMVEQFDTDKKSCKAAIRELVDNGRLVYEYAGGSFLVLPQ